MQISREGNARQSLAMVRLGEDIVIIVSDFDTEADGERIKEFQGTRFFLPRVAM